MASLDDLPSELLEQILSYSNLSILDHSAISKCSKRLCAIASHRAFGDVRIHWGNEHQIEAFEEALHESGRLRSQITGLRFECRPSWGPLGRTNYRTGSGRYDDTIPVRNSVKFGRCFLQALKLLPTLLSLKLCGMHGIWLPGPSASGSFEHLLSLDLGTGVRIEQLLAWGTLPKVEHLKVRELRPDIYNWEKEGIPRVPEYYQGRVSSIKKLELTFGTNFYRPWSLELAHVLGCMPNLECFSADLMQSPLRYSPVALQSLVSAIEGNVQELYIKVCQAMITCHSHGDWRESAGKLLPQGSWTDLDFTSCRYLKVLEVSWKLLHWPNGRLEEPKRGEDICRQLPCTLEVLKIIFDNHTIVHSPLGGLSHFVHDPVWLCDIACHKQDILPNLRLIHVEDDYRTYFELPKSFTNLFADLGVEFRAGDDRNRPSDADRDLIYLAGLFSRYLAHVSRRLQ